MASETPERLWLTRVEAAALCQLSPRQFDEVIRTRAKAAQRGHSRTLRFDGPKIVAALVAYRVAQEVPSVDTSDPLLAVGDSPALERYRAARASLAERNLAERDQTLVKANLINEALRPALSAMRSTGDRLVRKFGNEAGEIFNEGVSDFETAAGRVLNDSGSDSDKSVGGVDEDAATADAE